jgi:hypothetical protein
MNRANAYTILVGIALVVLPYLLTQSDVTVPPLAKVLLQAAILSVGVVARYLPAEGSTQKVEITTPVPVTNVAAVPDEPVDG